MLGLCSLLKFLDVLERNKHYVQKVDRRQNKGGKYFEDEEIYGDNTKAFQLNMSVKKVREAVDDLYYKLTEPVAALMDHVNPKISKTAQDIYENFFKEDEICDIDMKN